MSAAQGSRFVMVVAALCVLKALPGSAFIPLSIPHPTGAITMRPIETLRGIPRCGATNAASTYASPVLRRARWVANRSESKLCAEDVPSGDYSTAVEEKDEDMKMEEGSLEATTEGETASTEPAVGASSETKAKEASDIKEATPDTASTRTDKIVPFLWPFLSSKPEEPSSSIVLAKPQTSVVVTGATGRVGQLAVRRILELFPNVLVRAVVNDLSKGKRVLKDESDEFGVKLEIIFADLRNKRSVAKAVDGASAVVFCESEFSQNSSPLQRLANAVRLALNPNSVAEVEGVKEIALALKATKNSLAKKEPKPAISGNSATLEGEDELELKSLVPGAPRFVLLSSAAVTRPGWSVEDKAKFPAAAEVPIVKLNPLDILTVKATGEKELRASGVPYAVVRPCGLNDEHPRGRPIFSVGDLAAGRICREDVADVLARCLGTPEATGKTFEVLALPGLDRAAASPAKSSIGLALAGLPTDQELDNDPALLNSIREANYPLITQLRPVPLSIAAMQQAGD